VNRRRSLTLVRPGRRGTLNEKQKSTKFSPNVAAESKRSDLLAG